MYPGYTKNTVRALALPRTERVATNLIWLDRYHLAAKQLRGCTILTLAINGHFLFYINHFNNQTMYAIDLDLDLLPIDFGVIRLDPVAEAIPLGQYGRITHDSERKLVSSDAERCH